MLCVTLEKVQGVPGIDLSTTVKGGSYLEKATTSFHRVKVRPLDLRV